MVRLELWKLSILDSSFGPDSVMGSDSAVGFPANSESVGGFDSTLSAGSTLGMLTGSESAHSTTKECFQPSILQSIEGNLRHYAYLLHSMYTAHEETPSSSTRIFYRYNILLILDLTLLVE